MQRATHDAREIRDLNLKLAAALEAAKKELEEERLAKQSVVKDSSETLKSLTRRSAKQMDQQKLHERLLEENITRLQEQLDQIRQAALHAENEYKRKLDVARKGLAEART